MGSSAGGPGGSDDKPRGFSKFIRRASKVLRKDKSKRESTSGPSTLAPVKDSNAGAVSSSAPMIAPPAADTARTDADTTQVLPVPASISPETGDPQPTSTPAKSTVAMTAVEQGNIQEEKARALFAKYGLTLEPGEWAYPVKGDAERVEKKVRMRIHRTCHRCQMTFGAEKICGNCQHTRCKKCPRYPLPKVKGLKRGNEAATAAEQNLNQEEKARNLFSKYGITLEADEWTFPRKGDAPRIERKVRVRIVRTCHNCQTLFGADKVCITCQHTRCKHCGRYPVAKSKKSKGKEITTEAIAVDDASMKRSNDPLIMTERFSSKELGGRSTSRRICHKCETLFAGGSTQCEKCKHSRCPQCPREPPKTEGDTEKLYPLARRVMKPIRAHVRWKCEKCDTTFKDLENTCANCGHEKCDQCPRHPPETEEQPLDEEAVRSVEQRMKNMSVSPSASAA